MATEIREPRDKKIDVRVTASEKAIIENYAKAQGLKVSDFLRLLISRYEEGQ